MIQNTSSPARDEGPWKRDLWLLAALFGVLYFFMLGRAPLATRDEGRYAEIPREMLAAGDFVTPRLDGVNYFEKPPLVYWVVAACIAVFGTGETSLRVTPALFSVFGILATYAGARVVFGRSAGIAAACVLGTSALYFGIGHILILDTPVSVLMSATLFCFIAGVRAAGPSRRAWFYGLYATAALATLTKGLIGFLLTGAVMALWLAVFNQWKRLRPLYLPSGILLFLAIAAPWHVLAAQRNPTWANFYFVDQHWNRFTTREHGHFQPWFYFFPIVLAGLFPWMGFLAGGIRSAVAGGWRRRFEPENADRWYFIVWALFIFLFFSKSQSKLAPYILPVFPPLAVLIGAVVGPAWSSDLKAAVRTGSRIFAVCCAILALAVLAAVSMPDKFHIDPLQALELRPYARAIFIVLDVGAIVMLWASGRNGRARQMLSVLGATTVVFLGTVALAEPLLYVDTKNLAAWVRENGRPADHIYAYAGFFQDFMYYSGQLEGTVGYHGDEIELENDAVARASGRFIEKPEFLRRWAGPDRVLVVARRSEVETAALLADPAFHYRLLASNPDFYLLANRL